MEPGDVVGKLTVIRKTDEKTISRGPVWLCRCSCGREVTRSSNSLYNSKRLGKGSCSKCYTKPSYEEMCASAKRMRDAGAERIKAELRRRHWEHFRSLYTLNELVQLEDDTREDLVTEFGPTRNPTLEELGLGTHPATGVEPDASTASAEFYDEDVDLSHFRLGLLEKEELLREAEERARAQLASQEAWERWRRQQAREEAEGRREANKYFHLRRVQVQLVRAIFPDAITRFQLTPTSKRSEFISRMLELSGRAAG